MSKPDNLVPFESAILLQKLGYPYFDSNNKTGYYSHKTGSYFHFGIQGKLTSKNSCSAPNRDLVRKWIANKYNVFFCIEKLHNKHAEAFYFRTFTVCKDLELQVFHEIWTFYDKLDKYFDDLLLIVLKILVDKKTDIN